MGNGRFQIINRGTGTALDGGGQHHRRLGREHVGAQQQHQQPVDHDRELTGRVADRARWRTSTCWEERTAAEA